MRPFLHVHLTFSPHPAILLARYREDERQGEREGSRGRVTPLTASLSLLLHSTLQTKTTRERHQRVFVFYSLFGLVKAVSQ